MSEHIERYAEALPADVDRFLGDFFPRTGWATEVKYDHEAERYILAVTVADPKLADDERFLALIAVYVRRQRLFLRQAGSVDLRATLHAGDGRDLTKNLDWAAQVYLNDAEPGLSMGRRLAWLGVRRRIVREMVPRSLMWGAVILVLTQAFAFSLGASLLLCVLAIAVQSIVTAMSFGRQA